MGLISAALTSFAVGTAYFSAPTILSIVGFTKGGVVASSLASWCMSATAVASGGAVASGSVVSILQSAGTSALLGGPVGAALAVGAMGVAGVAAFILI